MFSKIALEMKPNDNKFMQGHCFKFNFNLQESPSDFILKMQLSSKQSFNCFEFLIFSTGKTSLSQTYFLTKNHVLKFPKEKMSKNEQMFTRKYGLKILRSCDKSSNFMTDIFKTLKMFVGGMGLNPKLPIIGSKIWDYQLNANIEMVEQYTGFKWQKRLQYKGRINYPKHLVRSGDALMITRFDGIDNIIHFGSGSKLGHSTIALWKQNELYICESQSALYFPRENIQCNTWDQWMEWADNADYNVILIPLKKKLADKFDNDKAWQYVNNLLGTTYGFHNFLFGWIDTRDQNLPDVVDLYFFSYISSILQEHLPDVIDTFLLQGLSQRLNKDIKKIEDAWEELYSRDMQLVDLMAIPEQDEWTYKNGKSLVCSSFIAGVLRAGGLFGNLKINVTEMTPKDVIDINFWDNSKQNIPKECKDNIVGDYCQIMGKVKLDIGKSSFLEPYDHMSEHCPTMIPNFNRTKNC